MRIMKIVAMVLLAVGALCLPIVLSAQSQQQTWVQRNKVINHLTSRTDTTTAQILTGYWPCVELGIYVTGTDSVKIITRVDYLLGTIWKPISSVGDTLLYGSSIGGAHGRGYVLRSNAANLIPGGTEIRVRNTITGYGTGDSTGVGKYTQYLLQRSP